MREYLLFCKDHYRPVFFGWILTFFSSFGQTFLISLFVPAILTQFALNKGEFGAFYAVATALASFTLLRFGHLIDEYPVRSIIYKVVFLFAIAALLLTVAWHPAILFLSLIGLRLGGQGLMSHVSISVMSRHFDDHRGKGLSIASLGYPMGEMIFPLVFGGALILWGWRVAASVSLVLLVGVLLPVLSRLNLEVFDVHLRHKKKSIDRPLKHWKFYAAIVRDRYFWMIAPSVFLLSFVITGLFFFQYVLAAERGWSIELYSSLFAGYALVSLLFTLYGGILTDRYSAGTLFPFYLLPLALGTLALALVPGWFAAAVFLFLTGISVGLNGVIKSAMIAEVYGVEHIGRVQGLFFVVMVLGTATAPLTFGWMLDVGLGFSTISIASATALVLTAANSTRILAKK